MPTTLRLLSVNAGSVPADRDGLAATIGTAGVDVACVHGSPSLLRWRSISAAMARKAGLVVVAGGRTGGANLIMSSLGVDVGVIRELRVGGNPLQPAGATMAVLRRGGSEVLVAAVRLRGSSAVRQAQAAQVRDAVASLVPGDLPVVVCADLPDRPGTAAWSVLAAGGRPAGTGIFVDHRLEVSAVEDTGPTAPVVVDLVLP